MKALEGKRVVVTGGTGYLGKALARRLLSGAMGQPEKVIVFSRNRAKQNFMRTEFQQRMTARNEIIYGDFHRRLEFRAGDLRNYDSVAMVAREADVIINAVSVKPTAAYEYFPYEAVRTNILGAENIVRAIQEKNLPVETVLSLSTADACNPINAFGMTRAIQERVFIQGALRCPQTRFLCVRYGYALTSSGSIVSRLSDQIRDGGPVRIPAASMTRFLLGFDEAVDCAFAALSAGLPGEIYAPRAQSALITDIASALIGNRKIDIEFTGIGPGQKTHEVLVSREEAYRTVKRGKWFAILPTLSRECIDRLGSGALGREYSSAGATVSLAETTAMLRERGLLLEEPAHVLEYEAACAAC